MLLVVVGTKNTQKSKLIGERKTGHPIYFIILVVAYYFFV